MNHPSFFIVWSDDRVSLVGMAARGHCEREGPIACDGRDEVGRCSAEAKPNLLYHRVQSNKISDYLHH